MASGCKDLCFGSCSLVLVGALSCLGLWEELEREGNGGPFGFCQQMFTDR